MSAFLGLLALGAMAGVSGCSSDPDDEVSIGARSCGNGVLDSDEACDTAIASGAAACPSSCDDGDPCTVDTLAGDACAAKCAHAPIAGCTPGSCGDGVLGKGETCDIAIKSGDGACATECKSKDACTETSLVGSGCQTTCTTKKITARKAGDGCCPAGATRTTDTDCPGAYAESCTASEDCASGMCIGGAMCTKTCTLTGSVSQCGVPGHFCLESSDGSSYCYPLVPTGTDTDDRKVGPGVPYSGNIDIANDADAFVADLPIGIYSVTVTPTQVPAQIDLAVDIYDGGANKLGTLNATGAGAGEEGQLTDQTGGRTIFVVRSANALQGSYTFRLDKKP